LALLDSSASEETIRRFLAKHVYFWNGLLRIGLPLYTKIRLGDEYEIDFALCDPSSDGAEWHLVEIEAPTAKLLTKRGDPSKELSHALRQVREWQRWIEKNRDYADRLMPGIDHPLGHVFMGRRSEIESPKAREHLRAINVQNRAHVEVGTLDRFVEQASTGLRTRHIARAKSHRELRAGLPGWLAEYARSDMGMDRYFLKTRRQRIRFDEDWPRPGVQGSLQPTLIEPVRVRPGKSSRRGQGPRAKNKRPGS
jgi:hypothetical protein